MPSQSSPLVRASPGAALTAAALAFEKRKDNGDARGPPDWSNQNGTGARTEALLAARDSSPRRLDINSSPDQSRPLALAAAQFNRGRPLVIPTQGLLRPGRPSDATVSSLAATLAVSRSASPSPDRRRPPAVHSSSDPAQRPVGSTLGPRHERRMGQPAGRLGPQMSGSSANPRGSHVDDLPRTGGEVATAHADDSVLASTQSARVPPSSGQMKHSRPDRHLTTRPTSLPPRRTPTAALPTTADSAVSSLASAMVAGSLASARYRTEAVASGSGSHRSHDSSPADTPRPRTVLPQTLRSHPRSDDEDLRRQRQRHRPLVSNRHTHHEGARRRWKEEISVRERKRFEALWASNRGLFLPGGEDGEYVANILVRDLWSRSRLPMDELAEVWDLVDGSGSGRLSKTEFVVGTWLLDQRLRGRKIPARVSASVWSSARGLKSDSHG